MARKRKKTVLAGFNKQQKVSWLEEIELNFDASFQQILTSELKILWEARSTPTLTLFSKNKFTFFLDFYIWGTLACFALHVDL
jgi:hypothetical protein